MRGDMAGNNFFHRSLKSMFFGHSTHLKIWIDAMPVFRRPSLAVLEFDESPLYSYRHSMGPVIGSQLRQDVRDVILDSFLCDSKPGGDLSIAVAGRYQAQNFDLARA